MGVGRYVMPLFGKYGSCTIRESQGFSLLLQQQEFCTALQEVWEVASLGPGVRKVKAMATCNTPREPNGKIQPGASKGFLACDKGRCYYSSTGYACLIFWLKAEHDPSVLSMQRKVL